MLGLIAPGRNFRPTNIAGLQCWLDASDSSTVTLNSTTVSEWRDKSGAGLAFTQATAAAQPTWTTAGQNGLNTLTFDASRRLVSTATASTWSYLHDGVKKSAVYVVCKASGTNVIRTIMATANSGNGQVGFFYWHDFGQIDSNTVRMGITNGVTGVGNNVTAHRLGSQTANTMRAFQLLMDPANATASSRAQIKNLAGSTSTYIDGTGTASANAPNFTLTIGSLSSSTNSLAFNGDICEIIIYSRSDTLGTDEQDHIMRYLARKWAL